MHTKLFEFLEENKITYTLYNHANFYTVEEAENFYNSISGANSKNLFLKDKKKNFFLLSILSDKKADLKTLSKQYGVGGLSFANEEYLKELLGLLPGSVTPYGLINDLENQVQFILDKDFLKYELVNFHPLRNDMTISVSSKDFLEFCKKTNHFPSTIEI
jgi:Ala-tRNA(Pro) deacylase